MSDSSDLGTSRPHWARTEIDLSGNGLVVEGWVRELADGTLDVVDTRVPVLVREHGPPGARPFRWFAQADGSGGSDAGDEDTLEAAQWAAEQAAARMGLNVEAPAPGTLDDRTLPLFGEGDR